MAEVTEKVNLVANDESVKNSLNQLLTSSRNVDKGIESLRQSLKSLNSSNVDEFVKKFSEVRKETNNIAKNINSNRTSLDKVIDVQSFIDKTKTARQELNTLLSEVSTKVKIEGLDLATDRMAEMKQSFQDIQTRLQEAFRLNDISGLKSASSELAELKSQAVDLQQILGSERFAGLNFSEEQAKITSFIGQIDSAASEAGEKIKEDLVNKIGSGLSKIKDLAKSSLNETMDIAKSAVSKYCGLLKSGFTSVFSYIQKKFSNLFSTKGIGSGLVSQIKSLVGVYAISKLVKEMYSLTDEAINMEGTLSNVFSSSSEDIREWSNEFAKRFSLTTQEAREFATEFGTVFDGLGISGTAQAEMSKNLTALTGDLASYLGITKEAANTKLSGAIAGNVKSLKSLGITMNDTTLNEYAMSRGLSQTYSDMSNANKAILRYNYILSQTSQIQGNASTSTAGWTNTIRMLKANLQSLGSIMGGALIKMLYPVVNVLNQIVAAAVNAGNALAKLFGFDTTSLSNLGAVGSSGASDIEDTADALNDEADALGNASDAAKDAADNLQSFDKLNNMQSSDSSSGSGTSGGTGGVGGLIDFDSYYENVGDVEDSPITKWLNGLWDLLSDKKWKDAGKYIAVGVNGLNAKIYKALTDKKVYNAIDSFSDAVTDFYDGLLDIDFKLIGKNFGAGFNLITYAINTLYEDAVKKDLLKKTGQKIYDFFDGILEEVDWQQAGKAFSTGMRSALDVLSGFLESAVDGDLGTKVGNSLKTFILGAVERLFGNGGAKEIGENISNIINLGFDAIIGTFGDGEAVSAVMNYVLETIQTGIDGIDGQKLSGAVTALLNVLGTLFNKLGDIDTSNLSDSISGAVNDAANNGSISNLAKGLVKVFEKLAETLVETVKKINWGNVAKALLDGIGDAIEDNTDGFKDIVEALAVIFGVKLVGKVGSFGIEKLGKKIASLFGTKTAEALTDSAVKKTISSAVEETVGDSVATGAETAATGITWSSTGWTVAGTAAGSLLVAGMIAGWTEKWKDSKTEKELTESAQEVVGNIELNADNVADYLIKLSEARNAYQDLRNTGENDISYYEDFLKTLKNLGYEGTETYNNLSKAVQDYNNYGGLEKAFIGLTKCEKAAKELSVSTEQSINFLGDLSGEETQVFDAYYDQINKAISLTETDIANLTIAYKTGGDDAAKAFIDSLNNGTASKTIDLTVYLEQIDDSVKITAKDVAELALAYKTGGTDAAEAFIQGLNESVNKDTTVKKTQENFLNNVAKANATVAEATGKSTTQTSIDAQCKTYNSDTKVLNALDYHTQNSVTKAEKTAETNGQTIGTVTTGGTAKVYDTDTSVSSSLSSLTTRSVNNALPSATVAGNTLGNTYTGAINSSVSADTSVSKSTSNLVTKSTSNAAASARSGGSTVGKYITDGVSEGIDNPTSTSTLSSKIKSLGASILNKFKDALDIHSPSKAFANLAKFIPLGVAEGVDDNVDDATDAIEDFSNQLMKKFNVDSVDVTDMFDLSGLSAIVDEITGKIGQFQSEVMLNPVYKQSELQAIQSQKSSTDGILSGMANISQKLSLGSSGKTVQVSVYLDANNKLGDFIIDTVNGKVIKGGSF
jgi:flagellar biosynthesis chaperone FliJ